MTVVNVLVALLGAAVVITIFDAAFRTFVLPRGEPVFITRALAIALRWPFHVVVGRLGTYESRDRVAAMYGPSLLVMFPVTFNAGLCAGYALLFKGLANVSWNQAVHLSASSLFTLGFTIPSGAPAMALVIVEAASGVMLTALLISYLPTIYSAFSKRELAVTQLSVRAGVPPTPEDLLRRAHLAGFLDQLDAIWNQYELWFVELEETHTSLAVLPFFRSPRPDRSWITTAGCILDAAAVRMSALDLPFSPQAGLCIRSGFLSLRAIADYFDLDYDPDSSPSDPISVRPDEFDALLDRLAAAGVPLRDDRDAAWTAFAGWRVNYDAALIGLASLLNAPPGVWSSDRDAPATKVALFRSRGSSGRPRRS